MYFEVFFLFLLFFSQTFFLILWAYLNFYLIRLFKFLTYRVFFVKTIYKRMKIATEIGTWNHLAKIPLKLLCEHLKIQSQAGMTQ